MFGKSLNFSCLNLLTWTENGEDCNDCAVGCPKECAEYTKNPLDEV